jgi:hypothetical protein
MGIMAVVEAEDVFNSNKDFGARKRFGSNISCIKIDHAPLQKIKMAETRKKVCKNIKKVEHSFLHCWLKCILVLLNVCYGMSH